MSREIIDHLKTIALASNLLYIEASNGEFGKVQRDYISDALKEIELLLAAEREKVREKTLLELDENCDMCGNPLGDAICVSCANQRVGAAVEECANRVKSFALTQEADIVKHQGNLTRRDVAGIIGARFAGSLVDEIRQLDLTQDLAPSTDEGTLKGERNG